MVFRYRSRAAESPRGKRDFATECPERGSFCRVCAQCVPVRTTGALDASHTVCIHGFTLTSNSRHRLALEHRRFKRTTVQQFQTFHFTYFNDIFTGAATRTAGSISKGLQISGPSAGGVAAEAEAAAAAVPLAAPGSSARPAPAMRAERESTAAAPLVGSAMNLARMNLLKRAA
eukprot:scaffold4412_cov71-Phaeocystis_antarctica.AAC.3